MARYYRTSNTQQEDYELDPRLYKGLRDVGAVGPRSSKKAESERLGPAQVGVIPDDIPAYQEVRQEYEQEIKGLIGQLRQSPSSYKQLEPRIADLRQRISLDNSPGGRLYAFDQRAKTYNQALKDAQETFKDDRDAYEFAVSNIDTGGGYIDPDTGVPIPVRANFSKLWNQKAEQDFLKTASSTITPKLLKDAEVRGLDLTDMKYKDASAIITELGYTPEQAREHVENLITPEMLRQMQYTFEYGKSRGQIPKEATFEQYAQDKVEGWSNSLAGIKTRQQNIIQEDTDAAWAMKRRTAAAGRPQEEISIGNFAPFVGSMVQTLESPDFRKKIRESREDLVPVPHLAADLNGGLGKLFGKDNVILDLVFNKKDNQFYYRSLLDMASMDGTEYSAEDKKKWRPLTTQAILNMSAIKGGTKFKAEALINHLNQLGVINSRQQFDWGKYTQNSGNIGEEDVEDLE